MFVVVYVKQMLYDRKSMKFYDWRTKVNVDRSWTSLNQFLLKKLSYRNEGHVVANSDHNVVYCETAATLAVILNMSSINRLHDIIMDMNVTHQNLTEIFICFIIHIKKAKTFRSWENSSGI